MAFSAPTIAIVSLAATAASAGLSAISAEKQGEASANAANYQAAVAQNNQILANQAAQQALDQGAVDAGAAQQKSAQTVSLVRAKEAAAGITLDSGSALDVQSDTAKSGALDALTIRNDAARKAYGFQVQGTALGSQAQFDVVQGEDAQQQADFKAATSLLGGASSTADQGLQFYNQGLLGSAGGTPSYTGARTVFGGYNTPGGLAPGSI